MHDHPAIRVVLADDHPVFRHGVASLLTETGEIEVVASVGTGAAAVEAVLDLVPDIAVLDLAMPGMSGVAAIRRLVERGSTANAIILSAYESAVYVEQAFEAGACGYVLKRSAFLNIAKAVQAVRAGGTYVDPLLPAHGGGHGRPVAGPACHDGKASLTEREMEILRYVAYGFTGKEIADRLGATPKAIETQKARACGRLGIGSRAQIVQYAIIRGWLDCEIPLR